MDGITQPADQRGQKTVEAIHSNLHRQLWEDLHDEFLAQRQKIEPRETLAEIRHKLVNAARRCR
jgi:hypothetical protein